MAKLSNLLTILALFMCVVGLQSLQFYKFEVAGNVGGLQ